MLNLLLCCIEYVIVYPQILGDEGFFVWSKKVASPEIPNLNIARKRSALSAVRWSFWQCQWSYLLDKSYWRNLDVDDFGPKLFSSHSLRRKPKPANINRVCIWAETHLLTYHAPGSDFTYLTWIFNFLHPPRTLSFIQIQFDWLPAFTYSGVRLLTFSQKDNKKFSNEVQNLPRSTFIKKQFELQARISQYKNTRNNSQTQVNLKTENLSVFRFPSV